MSVEPRSTSPSHRTAGAVVIGLLVMIAAILPGAAPALAAATGIDVQLPLGHQIRGLISDPDGGPVAGAFVDATDDIHFYSAHTGADGRYVMHGVADGEYRVSAGVEDDSFGFAYYAVPDSTPDFSQATIVSVAGGDAAGIDIRLLAPAAAGAATMSGTVVGPDGQPLAGVEILANGPAGRIVHTAADGGFRLGGLPAGDYTVFAQPPDGSPFLGGPVVDGHVGASGEDGTVYTLNDGDAIVVDVALARGRTLSGRVVVVRPAPIEVIAIGPGFGGARVESNGSFTINGLVPGEYQLLVRDAIPGPEQTETGNFPYGYVGPGGGIVALESATSFDLTDGDAAVGTIRVPRGTDITGQVTDGKTGLAGAYLFVCDVDGQLGCATANGAADGSFRVVHVPTGQFTIFVSVPGRVIGYYQPNGFTVEQFAASPIKVVSGGADVKGIKILDPAGTSIAGRITGVGGSPIAGAAVDAFPFGIPPNHVQPVTRADGRYVVTGLPTNAYGLFVHAPAGSDYVSGYYLAGAPGNFTGDNEQATRFRVIDAPDRQAPVIAFREPAANATDVGVDGELQMRFSEPVDNATPTTVQLRDPRGRTVPVTVTTTPEYRQVLVRPTDALQPGTRYRLTVTSAVVDWSGNHFAGASWSFTTSP